MNALNEKTKNAIWQMPKVELHIHLEGSLEPQMQIEIARRNGIDLGHQTAEKIMSGRESHNLPTFIASYNAAQEVMTTAEDFEDLAYSYLSKAAQQNVRHTEMFFDPQLHTSRGVQFEDIIGGYRRAIVRAEREFNISTQLIMCFVRDFSAEHAMTTLMQALPYRRWIVGVGMDSIEEGNPPDKLFAVYTRARREGFLLTFHSDLEQIDQEEHLRQGIMNLKVDRVDHGLHVLDIPDLLEYAQHTGLGFTATPLGYGTFTREMRLPQIHSLLKAGVRVSLGSDDPAFFGGYMNETLEACVRVGGFSLDELVQLQVNAIKSCWLPSSDKSVLLDELNEFAAAYGLSQPIEDGHYPSTDD